MYKHLYKIMFFVVVVFLVKHKYKTLKKYVLNTKNI